MFSKVVWEPFCQSGKNHIVRRLLPVDVHYTWISRLGHWANGRNRPTRHSELRRRRWNNGRGGMFAALHLHNRGVNVHVSRLACTGCTIRVGYKTSRTADRPTVRAEATLTLALPKIGLINESVHPCVGSLIWQILVYRRSCSVKWDWLFKIFSRKTLSSRLGSENERSI